MKRPSFYVINGITLYRIVAAPLLFVLVFTKHYDAFKWLLGLSFFTDLIDGYLARKYKVTSILGTKLDSIGDDLTVAAGIVGLLVFKPEFIEEEIIPLGITLVLFLIQTSLAFFRYGKMTGFHTYLAKIAAVLQGVCLLMIFFTHQPNKFLFYAAVIITCIELIEEIILVILLKEWKANIKGLYWIIANR